MTDTNEPNHVAVAEQATVRALNAFDTAIHVLESSVDVLKQDVMVGEKDVVGCLKQMNSAYLFAQQMKEKAREAGSERFGNAATGALDLDAARDEIRLRMACLRAAGDGGSVS